MVNKASKQSFFLLSLFIFLSGMASCSVLHDGKGLEHKSGESFIKYGPEQGPVEGQQEESIVEQDHGW